MFRYVVFTVLISVLAQPLFGQISRPGQPIGYQGNILDEDLVFMRMPSFDVDILMTEDEVLDTIFDIPWRFGENIPVELNPENSGVWSVLDCGSRVWHLGIASPGAYSLNLTFDSYRLPPGAEMYVYDTNQSFILGAFTDFNNQDDGYFATTLVPGDSVVIEYIEPADVPFPASLNLATVTHAYRDPGGFTKAFGQSGWCNLNVACDEAIGWEDQIRSVVMLVVGSNGFCSGVLINNTNNDARPFLLSANHCHRSPSSLVVWFNWESETCENPTISPPYDAMSGAVDRARNSQSDFWLMELNHRVPDSYQTYFAGWNRTLAEALSDTIVGIHHPRGDIKKFSYAEGGVQSARYLGGPGSGTTHWRITWDGGTTTEPASSGSPIFDGRGRIIGQLHGGYAACGNTQPDWYGRFGISWTGGGQPDNSLGFWLDPLGMNPDAIAGFDPVLSFPASVESIEALPDDQGGIMVNWTPNETNDMVLLAWNTENQFGHVAGYFSVGDSIPGGGHVLYLGYDSQFQFQQAIPGETYFFSAWSVQPGPYYSPGKLSSLTIPCPPYVELPFKEPLSTPSLPLCWTQYNMTGEIDWRMIGLEGHPLGSAVSGEYNLIFKHKNGVVSTLLASPWIKAGDFDLMKLSFYFANLHDEDGQDELGLLYRYEGDDQWTEANRFIPDVRSWTLFETEWPAKEDRLLQFAFEGKADGGQGVLVDAILLEGKYDADFPSPTALRVASLGSDRVSLMWDSPVRNDKLLPEAKQMPELTGYIVYRDGLAVSTVEDPEVLQFEDQGLAIDSYNYYVKALYDRPAWISEPSESLLVKIEEEDAVALNVSVSGPGSVFPLPGAYVFNAGAEVYFSARADSFASFDSWRSDGEVFSTQPDIGLSLSEPMDIEGVFIHEQKTLVLESFPPGSGIQSGGGAYTHGSQVTVATTIPDNVNFLYWTKGDQILSTRPMFNYRVVDNDTLMAVFVAPFQQILASVEPAWAGFVTGTGSYPFGSEVRLVAVEDNQQNYGFSYWAEGGSVVHEDPVYVFTADRMRNLKAVFEERLYALEVVVLPEGAGLTTPGKGINHFPLEAEVELMATPNQGWRISHWEIEGENIQGKFAKVIIREENPTVTAHFERITSIEDLHETSGIVRIYPNPVRDQLYLEWIGSGHQLDLQLLDVSGRVVFRETLPGLSGLQRHTIPTSFLQPGVYILRLLESNHIRLYKVVVY